MQNSQLDFLSHLSMFRLEVFFMNEMNMQKVMALVAALALLTTCVVAYLGHSEKIALIDALSGKKTDASAIAATPISIGGDHDSAQSQVHLNTEARELARLRADLAQSYSEKNSLDKKINSEINDLPTPTPRTQQAPNTIAKSPATKTNSLQNSQYPPQGSVMHVDAESGFLIANVGSKNGLKLNSTITVYREDQPLVQLKISDPQNILPEHGTFNLTGKNIVAGKLPRVGDKVKID